MLGKGRWRPVAGLTAAGIAYFLGFVGFGLWPLAFVSMPLAVMSARNLRGRGLVGGAVLYGVVALSGGFYWVVHLLRAFAYLPTVVAVFGYVLLIAYQGLPLAFVLISTVTAERRWGLPPVGTLMATWPAAEVFFPSLFPHSVGHGLYSLTHLTQIVDITGVPGLTLIVAAVSGALVELVRHRPQQAWRAWPAVSVAAVLVVGSAAYGHRRLAAVDARTAAAPTLRVGLVQANLGAREIRDAAGPFVRRHREMSRALLAQDPAVELIVWPEGAYNRLLARVQTNVKPMVSWGVESPLLFGVTTYAQPGPRAQPIFYNSAILAGADGEVRGRFDKVELLMFGETVPLADTLPFIRRWAPQLMTPGRSYAPLQLGPHTLLPMVCYEDILPAQLRRMWNRGGPSDVLVNLTNDSWYGDSHEPFIHLVLASFRTIEARRALIRSTNTGISAIVDPAGRIVARTGQWTEETLVYDVPMLRGKDATFFLRWGPIVAWVGLVLTVGGWIVVFGRRRAVLPAALLVIVQSLATTGCGSARIPYDLVQVDTRATPAHSLRVAVLPLRDGRLAHERPGPSDRYLFSGTEYTGTVLEDLRGDPMDRVTEVLARHLAKSRVFTQIILVRSADQAPQADLLLTGRVVRLRGYVEAEAPDGESSRPPDERKILSEVFLKDLRLRTPQGRVLLESDAGWSILQARRYPPDGVPTPWAIMSEALHKALNDFVELVGGADLSGAHEVRTSVALPAGTSTASLPSAALPSAALPSAALPSAALPSAALPFGDLSEHPPYGWRFSEEAASAPVGWTGPKTCGAASLQAQQTRRFHRVTGPYTPRVRLWACPLAERFRLEAQTEFPAELLGEGRGHRYFVWTLGQTNWPDAPAQISARLNIEPPASKYIFEVGPGARPAPVPRPSVRRPRRTPLRPNDQSPTR